MSVTKHDFGKLPDGTAVTKYRLEGKNGLVVSLLDYGATLQAIEFADKDLILGYSTAKAYATRGGYLGATVGRFANRIANGTFTLNGETYHVTKNERGVQHLHGGAVGFDKKTWEIEVLDHSTPTVCATIHAADMEEGFPGNLTLSVTFCVTDENALSIRYRATSDKDTITNFTNHAYFNLNGDDGGDILDTVVTVHADAYTPVDAGLIPTGEIVSVENTPFDLRTPQTWGDVIHSDHPAIRACNGVDHNFVLSDYTGALRKAMHAYSPHTHIAVTCYTDLPGIQIYTDNGEAQPVGKHGVIGAYNGFCMETQFFPDSPNQPAFPSCVLKAGDVFESTTVFAFDKI